MKNDFNNIITKMKLRANKNQIEICILKVEAMKRKLNKLTK
jgi:hypothetical protein